MRNVIALLLIFMVTSCTHKYYVPTYQPVPNVNHKNDLQGSFGLLVPSDMGGPQMTLSYSILKKLSFNILFVESKFKSDHDKNKFEIFNYLEGSTDYIQSLNKKSKLMLGFGCASNIEQHYYENEVNIIFGDETNIGSSWMKANKYFVQLSYLSNLNNGQLAISSRLSKFNFYQIGYDNDWKTKDYNGYKGLESNRHPLFIEPQLEYRYGKKRIQLASTLLFGAILNRPKFDYSRFAISTSLYFNMYKP